jgi:hypothetical protein
VPSAPVAESPYRIRHHWIVLLDLPSKWGWLGLAILVVIGITGGWLAWLPLLVVLGAVVIFRVQEWRAEVIELDRLTIRRARGVRETSVSHGLFRIDRISGVVLSQTVPGKLLHYGSLQLEAPGSHPDFRVLARIQNPEQTFELLESFMFRTARRDLDNDTDPNDVGTDDQQTSPLPSLGGGDTGRLPRVHPR